MDGHSAVVTGRTERAVRAARSRAPGESGESGALQGDLMRTLERFAFIAIIAVLAGMEARSEEGPSVAAEGVGNVTTTGYSSDAPAHAETALHPGESPLGRHHFWFKFGQTDFRDDTVAVWGVDQGTYYGLEYYYAVGPAYHVGGEIGATSAEGGVTSDSESIRDFGFYSLEFNNKWMFDLHHGGAADIGFGGAVFWVDGEEVAFWDGGESFVPLASFGYGAQVFADLTWRVNHFLIGVDAKYQFAFDWLYLNYSNLRFGVHVGMAF